MNYCAYEIKMNNHTVGAAIVDISNDDDVDKHILNLCNMFGFYSIDDYYICLTRGDGVYCDLEPERNWLDLEIAYKGDCIQPLVIRFQLQAYASGLDDLRDWNLMCSDVDYVDDIPPTFYISMPVKEARKYFRRNINSSRRIRNHELWFCSDWNEKSAQTKKT